MLIPGVVSGMSVARTQCPNCEFAVRDGDECPLCGTDLSDTDDA